jgi:hypothetical protein
LSVITALTWIPASMKNAFALVQNPAAVSLRSSARISQYASLEWSSAAWCSQW